MSIYLMLLETEGEKSLFQKIYEENYLCMYHISVGILKKNDLAENAVHDAFLSLAENFSKYSSLSCREMTGLCVTIVKHKSIDILRQQNHISQEEVDNLCFYNQHVNYEPVAHAEQQEEQAWLKSLMKKLPDTLRSVLTLKYYYCMKNREIAKLLGISVKTVEMRLYRGKAKLRELIESEKIK